MTLPQTRQLRQLRRNIGENIRAARMRRKMTLKKLSKRCGISINRLDYFECGRHEIGLAEIVAITGALDIGVERVVRGTPDHPKHNRKTPTSRYVYNQSA